MQPWLEGWMEKVSQGSLRRRRSLVVFEVKFSLQVVWVYGLSILGDHEILAMKDPYDAPCFFQHWIRS